jgi:site-specific DNA-methyltransferase (adenine-specific)
MAENVLYYGDNLEILRRYIEDESVDLVHLDPPFKSDQDYNILFAERNGSRAAAQINPILPALVLHSPIVSGEAG